MRVVLGDDADAQQPVQRARQLVTVQRRGLGVAQRQLLVAARAASEQEHVAGAVHRLQREQLAADIHLEHEVFVLGEVARGPERVLVPHERRAHLDVAALPVLPDAKLFERVPEDNPFGVPQGHGRRVLGEVEQVELRAEPAVVPLLRFLEALEVQVEIGLRVEGRPVDPRQLRVLLVAAPVRAREAGQLQRLDRLGALQVRAAAEVGEVALRVQRDRLLGVGDELDLVRLVLLLEAPARLVAGDLLALPRAALGELAADLLLDAAEVLLGDRLRELEVVVEAVLDRRPDRDLDPGIEPADGLGEQVRARVAQDGECVRIGRVARGQDLDLFPVLER